MSGETIIHRGELGSENADVMNFFAFLQHWKQQQLLQVRNQLQVLQVHQKLKVMIYGFLAWKLGIGNHNDCKVYDGTLFTISEVLALICWSEGPCTFFMLVYHLKMFACWGLEGAASLML